MRKVPGHLFFRAAWRQPGSFQRFKEQAGKLPVYICFNFLLMLILLADDDLEQMALTRYCLQQLEPDATIIGACNGWELLEWLDTQNGKKLPDLIILDLNMPAYDGRKTLAALKSGPRYAHLPVVIFSTSTAPLDQMLVGCYNAPMFLKSKNTDELMSGILLIMEWYRNKSRKW